MYIRILIVIIAIGFIFFILPNLFNLREQEHFSDEKRIEKAKEIKILEDTIEIAASNFYSDRSDLHLWLFGKKYRDVWNTKIKVPVFTIQDSIRTYYCYDIGGGDQTIAVEMKDNKGRVWTLRSIDKDQSGAISPFLKYSIIRPIVRDETAAANPYAAFVVDDLSQAADIAHTNPKLVYIPYLENLRSDCRDRMAGRLVLLEEELDEEGWSHNPDFYNADTIVDSKDMLYHINTDSSYSIDTLTFLKARLFDILIADWDRHEGNWAWALKNKKYISIPIDRDGAFYLFDDGMVNRFFLLFNKKFRSFHKEYKDITGFSVNSRDFDRALLKGVNEEFFLAQADTLQFLLTDSIIDKALRQYPDEVYDILGKKHSDILKSRRDKLKMAAKEFFTAINEPN